MVFLLCCWLCILALHCIYTMIHCLGHSSICLLNVDMYSSSLCDVRQELCCFHFTILFGFSDDERNVQCGTLLTFCLVNRLVSILAVFRSSLSHVFSGLTSLYFYFILVLCECVLCICCKTIFFVICMDTLYLHN